MDIEIVERQNAMPMPSPRLAMPAAVQTASVNPVSPGQASAVSINAVSPPSQSSPAAGSPSPLAAVGAPGHELAPAPISWASVNTGDAVAIAPARSMPGGPLAAPGAVPATPPAGPALRRIDVGAIARALPSQAAPAKALPRINSAAIGAALGRAAPKGGRVLTFREKVDLVRMIRSQITPCWNPPPAGEDDGRVTVSLRIRLDQRGALSSPPAIGTVTGRTAANAAYANALAGSVRRAAMRCSPLKLPSELYEAWSDVELIFDPRDIT